MLEKHFGAVTSIQLCPDSVNSTYARRGAPGELPVYVSSGRDSMLNLWNQHGECVGTQAAHRGVVNCISAVKPDSSIGYAPQGSSLMFSAGSDGLLKLWDLKRLKVISELQSGVVGKLVWFGQSLVTGGTNGSVKFWTCRGAGSGVGNDSGAGEASWYRDWSGRDIACHTQGCVDLVASDRFLCSASKSGQMYVWCK